MAEHNDFGKEAEDLAVSFLERKDYEILERNFRFQKAEIDIIAKYKAEIIIVEVKARAYNTMVSPQDAVNKKKIQLLVSAAHHYISEYAREEDVRFDIISILLNEKNEFLIKHIEDAFQSIDAQ